MSTTRNTALSHLKNYTQHTWYAFGISYKKAAVSLRQKFALSTEEILQYYLEIFPQYQVHGVVISTCNRLTFFLHGAHPQGVEAHVLRSKSFSGSFLEIGDRFTGTAAVRHLFELASGLDSQILGDFEIVGQLRKAHQLSKVHGGSNGRIEKIINQAVHCSRRVKNESALSSGTCSVSYAAVQFLAKHLHHFHTSPILVLGMGEIGARAVDNLVAARGPENVFISNRSPAKSEAIAHRLGVQVLPWSDWRKVLPKFSGIISSVAVEEPLLVPENFSSKAPEVLLDLSMPPSIDPRISILTGSSVFNIDQISAFLQSQMQGRAQAIPQARAIVDVEVAKFTEWEVAQGASPLIKKYHNVIVQRWQEQQKDAIKIDRIGQKIECRLFSEVRKDPSRVRDIEKWLKKTLHEN